MTDTQRSGPLDRLLGIFGGVRAGEGGTAFLMSLNIFLLLVGYYVLKTIREPLILMAGAAQLRSYAAAAQALVLIIYVPLYGWLAQRLPRQEFLMAVTSSSLVAFSSSSSAAGSGLRTWALSLCVGGHLQPHDDRPVLVLRMNTGKQIFWLPTSSEEKYKAKQAIGTFFVRFGDMLAAAAVFLGTHLLSFGVAGFARANITVVLIAIGVTVLLLLEYRCLTALSTGQPST